MCGPPWARSSLRPSVTWSNAHARQDVEDCTAFSSRSVKNRTPAKRVGASIDRNGRARTILGAGPEKENAPDGAGAFALKRFVVVSLILLAALRRYELREHRSGRRDDGAHAAAGGRRVRSRRA